MNRSPFEELLNIMSALRAPDGCPWDRKQTLRTLRTYLLEEVYELIDAMDEEDWPVLREELGDLLFHIVFQVQIAREADHFTMDDVIMQINEKLVRRHPHVFDRKARLTPEQVEHQWEKIKLQEGKKSVLSGVPRSLSALVRARRVQEKAAGIGFQWDQVDGALEKVDEEYRELMEALQQQDQDAMREEFGDFLFALINVSRYLDIDAEESLKRSVDKFMRRFRHIEQSLEQQGRTMADSNLQEMDRFWNEAKRLERRDSSR